MNWIDLSGPVSALNTSLNVEPNCAGQHTETARHRTMAAIPRFNEANLQAICDILGDTSAGLTGAQIGKYLQECGCPDPIPQMTKRHRLFASLVEKQNLDGCANGVLAFIKHAMNPVRHVGHKDYFETERGKLNGVLAFSGLTFGEDGQFRTVKTAQTLSEAEAAASILRKALIERKVHADCPQVLPRRARGR